MNSAKIYLFDTLSGKKELVEKPKGRPLRFFVCGPTVYDSSHIGHARTYLVFDALVKFLRAIKMPVFYLQNITDVDDKIIVRAKKEGLQPASVAKRFLSEYWRDMKNLGVDSVTKYAQATKYISQIVRQVQTLIKKGFAYEIPGDGYYFDISKFRDYGKLSRRTADQAEDSVSRIDENVDKRNKGDFALWKFSQSRSESAQIRKRGLTRRIESRPILIDGKPAWWSPWGWGRPGWHIEDTAISGHFFGPQYDLHGGGVDLKFPHHEAEIAQAEAASGKKPFVKTWLHTGALTIGKTKMSKSLGNFLTIRDFLKKYPAVVLRLLVLSHHYRTPLDYTEDLVLENYKKWESILEFIAKLRLVSRLSDGKQTTKMKNLGQEFTTPLLDDFNTPLALAKLFEFMSEIQPRVWSLPKGEARMIEKMIVANLETLGLIPKLPKIPIQITKLALARETFRRSKQFTQADLLRKKINGLGYGLDDTPLGPFVWPKAGVLAHAQKDIS